MNGSGGGLHLSSLAVPSAAFVGSFSTPIFNAAPISGLGLTGGAVTFMFPTMGGLQSLTYPTGSFSNAAGSFAGLSGGPPGGGVMPLNGVLFICLFNGGGGGAAFGCGAMPGLNLVVPLGVAGVGGTTEFTGAAGLTAVGAPWTIGSAAVFTSTVMGFAHDPCCCSARGSSRSG